MEGFLCTSGARRFIVLDFGKPILLTDVVIPTSTDLASLSIDIWVQGEEVDGQRLVVSTDIGIRSLILNNMMPPPVCKYLKVRFLTINLHIFASVLFYKIRKQVCKHFLK